jgi:MFS superfamily sulfate permease-like transporter
MKRSGLLKNLYHDSIAGVVVFLVALPLCLGIAQAVNAPPLAGLLSGIIGGIVITLLSPSALSVSGPAAGLIALTLSITASLGGSAAMLAALVLAGVLQVVMGFLRIGRLAGLIPGSVVQGLLVAIGLMLIIQQVPVALGYVPDKPWIGDATLHIFQDITPGSVFIMGGSLILLIAWEIPFLQRMGLTKLPAPLIVVLWGLVALNILPSSGDWSVPFSQRVQIPTWRWNDGWPLSLPDWSAFTRPAVYKAAFSIALIASLETLLSLEVTTRIDPLQRAPHSDRELIAQGAGNTISGLIGGLPLTAVIVRSSANVYAGGKTRFSAFLHGVLLLLSALFLAPLLNMIPLASLSAILIFTGYKLASPGLFIRQWHKGRRVFIPFVVTVIGIITVGMLEGIALGGGCALLLSVTAMEKHTLTLTQQGNVWLLHIHQKMTFMSKPRLCKLLDSIPDGSIVHIELATGVVLEQDLLEVIANFQKQKARRNLTLALPDVLCEQITNQPYQE